MANKDSQCNTLFDDDVLESLADLECNKSSAVKRARSSTRIRIKSQVIAQPGNSSDRLEAMVRGVTGDISAGGCQILFPMPLRVGDIYWLTFDKDELHLDAVFARCLRCRLIREDAYEAGFKFFEPIEMPNVAEDANTEALFG